MLEDAAVAPGDRHLRSRRVFARWPRLIGRASLAGIGALLFIAPYTVAASAAQAESQSGLTIYVANSGSDNISKINTATNTFQADIAMPDRARGPVRVAVTPDGKTALVVNWRLPDFVTLIDTTTDTIEARIQLFGFKSNAIAITLDGRTAYVTSGETDNVTVIDIASRKAKHNLRLPEGARLPDGVAVAPNGKTAYVANRGSRNVTVIDTATNEPVTNVPLPSGDRSPSAIAITPDGRTAYVTNFGSDNITPIDLATNRAGTDIALPSGSEEPDAIAITPNGKMAYVTNERSNNVTPIDLAAKRAEAAIALPIHTFVPRAIAITPDGRTAYVANHVSDNVTPIDLATNKAEANIRLPYGDIHPQGIAITPIPVHRP